MRCVLPLSHRPRAERICEKKVSGSASRRFFAKRRRMPRRRFSSQNCQHCSPGRTKIIDAYTAIFRPFSTVRRKLVLLLAILESCAPTHAYLDSVDVELHSVVVPAICSSRCVIFALIVMVGVLIILPAELMLRGNARRLFLWQPRNG